MDKKALERYILKKINHEANLSINIHSYHTTKLCTFIFNLSKWAEKANMVGTKEPRLIFDELILDSIYLADFFNITSPFSNHYNQFKMLDIGAGAGIPGIPFRILYENGDYLMVEPRKKRGVFINLMINFLQIKNTGLFLGNIEELREKDFDLCLSRAFCPWDKFLKLSKKYVKDNGYVLIFSNHPWHKDNLQGFRFIKEYSYILSSNKSRYFWLFSKKAPS
ncbi:16S rRNA (guanine(527)-N(7))-methyltransferase RsmG [Desulfothermus okinawensis JCM 13304]